MVARTRADKLPVAPNVVEVWGQEFFATTKYGHTRRRALWAPKSAYSLARMNVVGHGIDLVECDRIASVLERHADRFLNRILTEAERRNAARFKNPIAHIAGRFAAKEAVLKVLGTGWRGRISWHDIEIVNDRAGQPLVTLRDECARIADGLGIKTIRLSITHTSGHAAASAIGLGVLAP